MIKNSPEGSSDLNVISLTLRDLLQNPEMSEYGKYSLTIPERLELFEAEFLYGIRIFEVFAPIVNCTERNSLEAITERRNQLHQEGRGYAYILAHARCETQDIDAAIQAGVDGLNLYIPTSEELKTGNRKKSATKTPKDIRTLIEGVRKIQPHLLLRFSGEDFGRSNSNDIYDIYDNLADSVDRFGMPDTTGIMAPSLVTNTVQTLKNRYPNHGLEGHFHNDRGLSLINALTGIQAGMNYIDASLLGLAERSGITSLTALLFNLYLEQPQLTASFNLESSYELNVLMASIIGMQVPFTEPINIKNRTHSAGVHTAKMLNNPGSYEAFPWEKFGLSETLLLLGPLSGWHVVGYYLRHYLNYEGVTDEVAKEITPIFKEKYSNGSTRRKPSVVLNQIAKKRKDLQQIDNPITYIVNK